AFPPAPRTAPPGWRLTPAKISRWSLVANRLSFLYRRILGPRGNPLVILQRFVGQLDGLLELRVAAAHDQVGPLRHNIVGIHSVLLDDPFASIVGAPESEARSGDKAAVAQRLCASNPDQPAPRARAHDWSDFLAMEKPRKGVAARSGQFVHNHYFRSVDRHWGQRHVGRITWRKNRQQLP